MPSVKNTPDKKQEEVRRACLQWELQQERHLSIFQRVTSPFFFYSLQPPSTAPATGASLVRKSSVLRAASALGIINEKPQPIVYTPRRAWITQPTTVSKTWGFLVIVLCKSTENGEDEKRRTCRKITSIEVFLYWINNPTNKDDFVVYISLFCFATVLI